MKSRRSLNLLVEPPSVATGDIAFNLIVFFLVCASTQPESGRKQELPRSEPKAQQQQQSQNLEVLLTRTTVKINGETIFPQELVARLRDKLKGKERPEDRVVVVKSSKDCPYEQWIQMTGKIEEAGGIVTLQLEEEQTVIVNQ